MSKLVKCYDSGMSLEVICKLFRMSQRDVICAVHDAKILSKK